MKIQLLIASDDDDYREQLSQVLTERYSDTFEVSVCSSAPRLAEQLSRRVFDAALLEPELAEHVQLSQVRMPLLLWNGSAGCAVSEHVRQIRKYQRISSMVSQLLEQYAAVAEKSGDAELERGRITVVWSPSGGCGKTTAALAYAAQRAGEGKKSLYLDLEAFSSGPVYFSQNGKSISSVFEKLDENVELLLQSIRQKDAVSGIFYFSQPENYDDISILTQEDVRLLVNASVQGIDELVIDLSSTFDDKIQMLLELADRILLVTDSSRASQQKLEQFRTQHSIYEKVREKTIQVANKGFRIHSEEGEHAVLLPLVKSSDPVPRCSRKSFVWKRIPLSKRPYPPRRNALRQEALPPIGKRSNSAVAQMDCCVWPKVGRNSATPFPG